MKKPEKKTDASTRRADKRTSETDAPEKVIKNTQNHAPAHRAEAFDSHRSKTKKRNLNRNFYLKSTKVGFFYYCL